MLRDMLSVRGNSIKIVQKLRMPSPNKLSLGTRFLVRRQGLSPLQYWHRHR